uniref:Uncharacterized protein n=1 Tax=Avena sativa TaxID=4498 RepID=A0ACD5ZMG0_AVESA
MAQLRSPLLFRTPEISSEMRKKQKQEDEQEQQPWGSLPEGPLFEILSRVPYMSLCRFKCVSKPWLALCSDPDIRKRSPQTLSGFIHLSTNGVQFRNLSGKGPPMFDPYLPFLCKSYINFIPKHYCGGLVLCRCWKSCHSKNNEYNLVVCNPATEKWIELPPCTIDWPNAPEEYLGFDPAVPSRFVVFAMNLWEFIEVMIYSSDTGRWTTLQSGWIDGTFPVGHLDCVFLNGTMHLMTTEPSVATV